MTITIPDPVAKRAQLQEDEAVRELALILYEQSRLSGSEVRALCHMSYFEFERCVSQRGLPSCIMPDEELEHELQSLRQSAQP